MALQYFKRYRMEFDLSRQCVPEAGLPEGYCWSAWSPQLLERHASTKYLSFRSEVDSQVFPCLGSLHGCLRLMSEIAGQDGFLPGATWLISYEGDRHVPPHDCGTIQGLAHSETLGAVQNVGVAAEHRGLGIGRALILRALRGFGEAGLKRVYLEVTASNQPAVDLYRAVGFRLARTMYRAVNVRAAERV